VERRRLIRSGVAAAALLALIGLVVVIRAPSTRAPQAVRQRVDAEAPAGVRIRVEVLNATRVRGLARRATMHLRDRGFDVVNVGTSRDSRDSTLVLDRSGNAEWAALVARALGGARVERAPDSSRYLDVTVLVGATWRPPTEPFYP
jgi:hypothetical protein